MPVTFFIILGSLFCFVIIDYNPKPKQNDVAIANVINRVLFILFEFLWSDSCFLRLPLIVVRPILKANVGSYTQGRKDAHRNPAS